MRKVEDPAKSAIEEEDDFDADEREEKLATSREEKLYEAVK